MHFPFTSLLLWAKKKPKASTLEKKRLFFDYYAEGVVCRCGRGKEKRHWCCEVCKSRIWTSPEGLELARGCDHHYEAATAFLDSIAPASKLEPLKVQWACKRCNTVARDGRCQCTESPSPWVPMVPCDYCGAQTRQDELRHGHCLHCQDSPGDSR